MTEKRKSWRDTLEIHPACELLPPLSEDELRVIGKNIRQRGLANEIVIYKKEIGPHEYEFSLLDGRSRLDAMALVGIDFRISHRKRGRNKDHEDVWELQIFSDIPSPLGVGGLIRIVGWPWGELDPYQYVVSANLHRRHLNAEQKRAVIEKLLKAQPEKSDRQIAKMAKADRETISRARKHLEATGGMPPVEKRIGADGKSRKQPAKRAKRTPDDDIKAKHPNQPKSQAEASKPIVSATVEVAIRTLTNLIAHSLGADPIKTAQTLRMELGAELIDKLVGWLDQLTTELKEKPTAPRSSVVVETDTVH